MAVKNHARSYEMIDHEFGAGAKRPVEMRSVYEAVGYRPDCEVIEERPSRDGATSTPISTMGHRSR